MPDFDGIATALAARFITPALAAPPAGGYDTVRTSTANLPNVMGPLPAVLVFLDSGNFRSFGAKRDGEQEWTVRFYYGQWANIDRDMKALRLWLTILVDQLKGALQLGGLVTSARTDSWQIGKLTYAGQEYGGIELTVHVVTNEAWQAVA